MDYNYFIMIVKLVFSLVVVLSIIYLLSKVTSNKIQEINKDKYIKVLERTQISKDTMISIVKVGDKGYIMSTSQGRCSKIDDLSPTDIEEIEMLKKKEIQVSQKAYQDTYNKFIKKVKKITKNFTLKDESYEK